MSAFRPARSGGRAAAVAPYGRLAVGVLVAAGALAGHRAFAQGTSAPPRGVEADYLVFELDASGVPRPLSHQVVRLSERPSSRSDAAVVRRLAAVREDAEQVVVRLLDAAGRVTFQDVVEVPGWVNVESGLHGGAGTDSGAPRPARKAFAVRVPLEGGARLRLSVARGTAQGAPLELDLPSLRSDDRLPLAALARRSARSAPPPGSGNRVDFLLMGDGYPAQEEAKFAADAARVLDGFFGIPPYRDYQSFVNVATLFTASAQSGADHPPFDASCSATLLPTCCGDPDMQSDPRRGTFVDTAFDATYCSYNIHRLLVVNPGKVLTAAAAWPDWDKVLVLVNDATYGGSGGSTLVSSTHAASLPVAQHEYGHSFTGLADEYSSPYPGFPACSDLGGAPPCETNVTDRTARDLVKWNAWIDPFTPIPTTGADASVVGLFEGARYQAFGMYRPQLGCLMRSLDAPFCRVCAEAYVRKLYSGGWGTPAHGIDLVDPGTETPPPGAVALALPASQPFGAGLLQPTGNTVSGEWTVNDAPAASGSGFTLRAATPGTYVVTLRTRDVTPFVGATSPDGIPGGSRTWTVEATGTGSGIPSAAFDVTPASPEAGQEVQFTHAAGGGATSWRWSFGDGGASTAESAVHVFSTAGTWTVQLTVSDGSSWSTTSKSVTVRAPGPVGSTQVLTVPIVLSSRGANGSFFTSELALTNRGETDAAVTYDYTAAFGGSSGRATDTLPAGRQVVRADAVDYLKRLGIPLGESGDRGGTLRITFTGLSAGDAGAATVRTSTSVPGGRAGLAYAGVPAARLLTSPVFLCGLRQNAADRSNVAVLNAGGPSDGKVTLRLTVLSGDPANPATRTLPEVELSPGGFHQVSGVLAEGGPALPNGIVRVERIAGSAPFLAYGVVNDQVNSDGSYVEPVPADPPSAVAALTLPVVVETGVYSTEAVLANLTSAPRTLRCTWTASALPGGSVSFDVELSPFEQQILPDFVKRLRERGVVTVPAGATFAGALHVVDASGDLRGVFLGARTSAPGGGGRYGVFYPAVPAGSEAAGSAWLFGLQQTPETRSNLALVNVGSAGESADVFRVDLFDGATGSKAASVEGLTVPARGFLQVDAVLARHAPGVVSGYALVTRTAGTNPFVAYAVVNDGGAPGQRSGDGAFVAATFRR